MHRFPSGPGRIRTSDFYDALTRTGLAHEREADPPLRCHDLRHTFGTLAVKVWDLRKVQGYMGHASITTTQLYMHHVPKHSDADDLTRLVEKETEIKKPQHLRLPSKSTPSSEGNQSACHERLFFRKTTDWETEHEYRFVVTTPDIEYVDVDFGDALDVVAVGENCPPWQWPAVVEACQGLDAEPLRVEWSTGAPRAWRLRPAGAAAHL